MSCVVGIVDNEAVWMAADSLNSIEGLRVGALHRQTPRSYAKMMF